MKDANEYRNPQPTYKNINNNQGKSVVQINSNFIRPNQYQPSINLQHQKNFSYLKFKYQKALDNFTASIYYIVIFAVITIFILLFTNHLVNTYHLTIAQLGLYASYISWGLAIVAVICSIYLYIRQYYLKIKLIRET